MKEQVANLFVMSITPDYARYILSEKNKFNRPISQRTVDYYASMMERGQWLLNGETIKFDWNGNLIDGQHRLKAVVKANKVIDFHVVNDLDPETYSTIDKNKIKTLRDDFHHDGIPNNSRASSIVRKYMQLVNNISFTSNRTSKMMKASSKDFIDLYNQHAEAFQSITRYSACLVGSMYLYSATEIGGIIAFLTLHLGYDLDTVSSFMNILFQYQTKDDFIPCRLLRERITKASLRNEKIDLKHKMNLLIRAWEYYIEGNEAKKLSVKSEEGTLHFKPADQIIKK